jgi:hypothetical protein
MTILHYTYMITSVIDSRRPAPIQRDFKRSFGSDTFNDDLNFEDQNVSFPMDLLQLSSRDIGVKECQCLCTILLKLYQGHDQRFNKR